jgi:hypothetical protein
MALLKSAWEIAWRDGRASRPTREDQRDQMVNEGRRSAAPTSPTLSRTDRKLEKLQFRNTGGPRVLKRGIAATIVLKRRAPQSWNMRNGSKDAAHGRIWTEGEQAVQLLPNRSVHGQVPASTRFAARARPSNKYEPIVPGQEGTDDCNSAARLPICRSTRSGVHPVVAKELQPALEPIPAVLDQRKS